MKYPLLLLLTTLSVGAAEFTITTDRESARYGCGEDAVFTVSARDAEGKLLKEGNASVHFRLEKQRELLNTTMDMASNNPAAFTITLAEPGFVWCTVNNPTNEYIPSPVAAAGFDAERIVATTVNPPDWDAFWQNGIAELKKTPLDAKMTELSDFEDADFKAYRVSLTGVGNTRAYGFLAVPKNTPGPFPVILSVPGVGPGADRPDLRYFKNPKVMTLIMNVHPEDSDRTTAAVMEGTYACDGAPDREAYFFRRATLGINRAFEFLETLPEWDHENIGLWGSSQGGAYALILAGLNPGKIKFVAANVPALCEHTAHLVGRSSGWPLLLANTPAGTEAMAPYFDTVNFARRIADPVVIGVGWIDAACGPSSVYAAYNQITSDKEIFDGVTMGHDFDPRFVAYMVPAMYKALGVE